MLSPWTASLCLCQRDTVPPDDAATVTFAGRPLPRSFRPRGPGRQPRARGGVRGGRRGNSRLMETPLPTAAAGRAAEPGSSGRRGAERGAGRPQRDACKGGTVRARRQSPRSSTIAKGVKSTTGIAALRRRFACPRGGWSRSQVSAKSLGYYFRRAITIPPTRPRALRQSHGPPSMCRLSCSPAPRFQHRQNVRECIARRCDRSAHCGLSSACSLQLLPQRAHPSVALRFRRRFPPATAHRSTRLAPQ